MNSSIEIYMGSKTENICLCAVPGSFNAIFTVWFQGGIWLFSTGKMTYTFLDHTSKTMIILNQCCCFSRPAPSNWLSEWLKKNCDWLKNSLRRSCRKSYFLEDTLRWATWLGLDLTCPVSVTNIIIWTLGYITQISFMPY